MIASCVQCFVFLSQRIDSRSNGISFAPCARATSFEHGGQGGARWLAWRVGVVGEAPSSAQPLPCPSFAGKPWGRVPSYPLHLFRRQWPAAPAPLLPLSASRRRGRRSLGPPTSASPFCSLQLLHSDRDKLEPSFSSQIHGLYSAFLKSPPRPPSAPPPLPLTGCQMRPPSNDRPTGWSTCLWHT